MLSHASLTTKSLHHSSDNSLTGLADWVCVPSDTLSLSFPQREPSAVVKDESEANGMDDMVSMSCVMPCCDVIQTGPVLYDLVGGALGYYAG